MCVNACTAFPETVSQIVFASQHPIQVRNALSRGMEQSNHGFVFACVMVFVDIILDLCFLTLAVAVRIWLMTRLCPSYLAHACMYYFWLSGQVGPSMGLIFCVLSVEHIFFSLCLCLVPQVLYFVMSGFFVVFCGAHFMGLAAAWCVGGFDLSFWMHVNAWLCSCACMCATCARCPTTLTAR